MRFGLVKRWGGRQLFENAASLYLLHIANVFLPFILVPYLSRVLGVEKYGLYMYANSIAQYLVVLVNYGFNIYGVKYVSEHVENREKINVFFNEVIYAKFLLLGIGALLLLLFLLLSAGYREEWLVFLSSFGITVGMALNPLFLYHGMQKMQFIAFINIAFKITIVVLMFLIIDVEKDYMLASILNGFGYMLAGLVAFVLVFRLFPLSFLKVTTKGVLGQLRNSGLLFISQFSISLYSVLNAVIVGVLFGVKEVAFYLAAEKIVQLLKFSLNPVINSLLPFLNRMHSQSEKRFIYMSHFVLIVSIVLGLIGFASINVYSEKLLNLIYGEEFLAAVRILNVFSFLIILTPVNHFIFNVVLVVRDRQRAHVINYLTCAVLNISFLLLFVVVFDRGVIGVVYSNVIAQGASFLYAFYNYVNEASKCLKGKGIYMS